MRVTISHHSLPLFSQFASSLGAQDVDSFLQLVSGNKTRRIMTFLVQAGREILQEAPVRTLEILLGAIHAAQAQPIVTHSSGTRCLEGRRSEEDVLDVVDVYSDHASLPSSISESNGLGEYVSADEAKPPSAYFEEIESVGRGGMKEAPTLSSERVRHSASPKGRRARDFDARKERAADRKAKTERLRRQQELVRLKKAEKEADEALKQQEESNCMQHEDGRSAEVDRHTR